MAKTWGEIAKEQWERHGKQKYAPVWHGHTEGTFSDRGLSLKERYIAWIVRTTWGNGEDFCSHRPGADLEAKPLFQADAARTLGISKQAISVMTARFQKEGRIHVDAQGRIWINERRGENVSTKAPIDETPFIERWRIDFPQGARQIDKARRIHEKTGHIIEKWRTHQRRYIRHLTKAAKSTAPLTGELFGSVDEPAKPPTGSVDGNVNGLIDQIQRAPLTPSDSSNIGTRVTNNKQQQQGEASPAPPPEDVVVVVKKFGKYGSVSEEHARKFLELCAVSAGLSEGMFCRVEDVAAVIDRIGPTISDSVRNKVGVLLKAVPPAMLAYIANKDSPQAMAAAAGATNSRRQPDQLREATPAEIEEHKARGTYIPPKRR